MAMVFEERGNGRWGFRAVATIRRRLVAAGVSGRHQASWGELRLGLGGFAGGGCVSPEGRAEECQRDSADDDERR